MEDLSLHILDIVENAIEARAGRVEIMIDESQKEDRLTVEINDNGKGMDERTLRSVTDPFFTSRTTRRVGLGIPLLKQAAEEAGGDFNISSEPGSGTRVKATFVYSHIDRKPVGDLAATVTVLVASHPEIDFIMVHRRDSGEVRINTGELRQDLGSDGLRSPAGLKFIRQTLNVFKDESPYPEGETQGGYYGGSNTGAGHPRRV